MASLTPVRELVSAEDPIPATMTVDRYLGTMFHPDCDFVDGRIEERNVGEYGHSVVQKMLLKIFIRHEAEWRVEVLPECRTQVAATRFRVPDVLVLRADHGVRRIVREAPLICMEVVSPEDTWTHIREVLSDFLAMGVEHIWVFDPETRVAHRFDADGLHVVQEDELGVPGTAIRVSVAEVFSTLRKE